MSFEVCEEELPDLSSFSKKAVVESPASPQVSTPEFLQLQTEIAPPSSKCPKQESKNSPPQEMLLRPTKAHLQPFQLSIKAAPLAASGITPIAPKPASTTQNVPAAVFNAKPFSKIISRPDRLVISKKRNAYAIEDSSAKKNLVVAPAKKPSYIFTMPTLQDAEKLQESQQIRENSVSTSSKSITDICSKDALEMAEVANRVCALPDRSPGMYDICIPTSKEGLLVNLGHMKEDPGTLVFIGYRRLSDGTFGPAESLNLFRRLLDRVLAIDGVILKDKLQEETMGMLQKSVAKPMVFFRVMDSGAFEATRSNPIPHAPAIHMSGPPHYVPYAPYMVSPIPNGPIPIVPAPPVATLPFHSPPPDASGKGFQLIAPAPVRDGEFANQYQYMKKGTSRGSYTSWEERFVQLLEFRKSTGHFMVPKDQGHDLLQLSRWVIQQRHVCTTKLKGTRPLPPYQKDRLSKLITIGLIPPQGKLQDVEVIELTDEILDKMLENHFKDLKESALKKGYNFDLTGVESRKEETFLRREREEVSSSQSTTEHYDANPKKENYERTLQFKRELNTDIQSQEGDHIPEHHHDGQSFEKSAEQKDMENVNEIDQEEDDLKSHGSQTSENLHSCTRSGADADNIDHDLTDHVQETLQSQSQGCENDDQDDEVNSVSSEQGKSLRIEDETSDESDNENQQQVEESNGHSKRNSSKWGGKHWSEEEDRILLKNAHMAGKWTEFARLLEGRSASSVRNHFHALQRRHTSRNSKSDEEALSKRCDIKDTTNNSSKHSEESNDLSRTSEKKEELATECTETNKSERDINSPVLETDKKWLEKYEELRIYRTVLGTCKISNNRALSKWCEIQRREQENKDKGLDSQMTEMRYKMLKKLDFWNTKEGDEDSSIGKIINNTKSMNTDLVCGPVNLEKSVKVPTKPSKHTSKKSSSHSRKKSKRSSGSSKPPSTNNEMANTPQVPDHTHSADKHIHPYTDFLQRIETST